MGKNKAISIGINNYEFLTPLKYAKRDAELMQDFFRNQAGFEQVLFLSDDSLPDTKGNLIRPSFSHLRNLLLTKFEKPFMGDGDNFWFFFSGHGRRDNGRDYLMACDSNPNDIESTGITINFLTERLRRCGADNVILILDACRDRGSKSGEGIGNQAAQVAREKGVVTFFSCSPNQLSYEIDALKQGIFTKALLEGLSSPECATVGQLNDYLSSRVPKLIWEYKGNEVQQTPITIAEPDTKSHLIILPQHANRDDIYALKVDAFQAEVDKNFELAEQLWIRVFAASFGKDMSAIQAIKRIDRLQRENQASSQDNSVSASVAKQAESPLSPKSKLVTDTTPIEPDVPLKSERGIDYTKLRDLLAAGKWKEADEETARVMLKVAGREKEGWLDSSSIDNFPCEDLRTIDQLWVKYSNGRFGFSVQKRIYQSLGGTRQYDSKIWEAFGDRVGWRVNKSWLGYDELKFNTQAPAEGHLPSWGGWWCGGWVGLFSRVETCKV
ncbi:MULTISPECIES: GUN4 domain-containing protein [Kamptonema]|uniref:GUN4 domain-containing protein n=1 Tax=Kamptonema TaxID=1501433 RepID=UPI0001DAD6A4|nr:MULTISPECIES: GUN4 domain-containing protein [Kamptonema]CBN58386.1 hypothetical protein OSCI_3750005 [Kamptonema sp. PCC 6506]